jgi:hemolysin activation/secretion protein
MKYVSATIQLLFNTVIISLFCNSYIAHAADSQKEAHKSIVSSFKFQKLYIADSEEKVNNLINPSISDRLVIMDVPVLNNKEFLDLIQIYFEKPITPETLNEISQRIKSFIISRFKGPVSVVIPKQNVSKGDIRLVVVTGKYTLAKLYFTNYEKSLLPFSPLENSGQIVWDSLPSALATPEFLHLLSPYFGQPITAESINKMIVEMSSFITSHGEYLAGVQFPQQNTEDGTLRIGIKLGRYPLHRLIITNSPEAAAAAKITSSKQPIVTLKMPLYDTDQLRSFISKYLDKPITIDSVYSLEKDLVDYAKKQDRAIVQASSPILDLDKGEIKIAIIIGRYKQLHFSGNRWYSDALLQKRLGINPGDEVRTSQIDSALNSTNQSPFRQVQMLIDTVGKPLGVADLDIAVQEVLPVKLAVSYSNAVYSPLGDSSYSSNLQVGNLWGLDQEFNMQYSTNNTPKYDQSYSFDYKVPLPWHDTLRFDVAYSLAYPQALFGYVGLNEKAKNTVADVTYSKSITKSIYSCQLSSGIDYKQVNTNMFFGEFTQPISTYDVAQVVLSASVARKDKYGSWILGGNIDLGPGNINNRSTDKIYGYDTSGNATNRAARYEYGRIMLERDQILPWKMQLISRIQVQFSSTNLQGSEQFVIGGGATIRGYSETLTGDQGFVINEELHSPLFQNHLPFLKKKKSFFFNTKFVGFLDYGQVSYKHPILASVPLAPLMGTGLGVRASITGHFSMGVDYGWQLRKPIYYEPHTTRGSFWGTLAY